MKKEIEIYRQSFGTDPDFEEQLFKIKPKTLKLEGETVSQFFLLPCRIKAREKIYSAKYLFAACTDEKHRRKGYMAKLIKSTINNETIILRPANEGLIKYYKKLGFLEFNATDRENNALFIEPLGDFKALTQNDKTTDGSFTLMAINSPVDLSGVSFAYTMP